MQTLAWRQIFFSTGRTDEPKKKIKWAVKKKNGRKKWCVIVTKYGREQLWRDCFTRSDFPAVPFVPVRSILEQQTGQLLARRPPPHRSCARICMSLYTTSTLRPCHGIIFFKCRPAGHDKYNQAIKHRRLAATGERNKRTNKNQEIKNSEFCFN